VRRGSRTHCPTTTVDHSSKKKKKARRSTTTARKETRRLVWAMIPVILSCWWRSRSDAWLVGVEIVDESAATVSYLIERVVPLPYHI